MSALTPLHGGIIQAADSLELTYASASTNPRSMRPTTTLPPSFAPLLLTLALLVPLPAAAQVLTGVPDSVVVAVRPGEARTITLTVGNTGGRPLAYQISTRGPEGAGGSAATVAAPPAASAPAAAFSPADLPAPLVAERFSVGEEGASKAADGPTERYVRDDGASNSNMGTSGESDFMWMNAFEAEGGRDRIGAVSVAWGIASSSGSVDVGRKAEALIYEDPDGDGDPSDGRLLARSDVVVLAPDTDRFTRVNVGPVEVEGTFFVAILMRDKAADEYPAAYDIAGGFEDASWYVIDHPLVNTDGLVAEDLSKNMPPSKMPVFRGNWLLRADVPPAFDAAISHASGVLEPDAEQGGELGVRADSLAPGRYAAELVVASNSTRGSTAALPFVLVVDGEPPAAPEALAAAPGPRAVALSWTPSADASASYDLYRGTEAGFDTTGARVTRLPAGATSHLDRDVEGDATYYYRLVAVDAAGNRSGLTAEASAVAAGAATVRLVHAVSEAQFWTSDAVVGGARLEGLAYGRGSGPVEVAAGVPVAVTLSKATASGPASTAELTLADGAEGTLVLYGAEGGTLGHVLLEGAPAQSPGAVTVRFAHAADGPGPLSVTDHFGGPTLAAALAPGAASDAVELEPRAYTLALRDGAGGLHTTYRAGLGAYAGEALTVVLGREGGEATAFAVTASGEPAGFATNVSAEPELGRPSGLAVRGTYPSPATGQARVVFDAPASGRAHVEVYDLLGRRVLATPPRPVGAGPERALVVDAGGLASGAYLVRLILEAGGAQQVASGRLYVAR